MGASRQSFNRNEKNNLVFEDCNGCFVGIDYRHQGLLLWNCREQEEQGDKDREER